MFHPTVSNSEKFRRGESSGARLTAAMLALLALVSTGAEAQEGAPDLTVGTGGVTFIAPDFGGTNNDFAGHLETDTSGKNYIVGWSDTASGNFDAFLTIRDWSGDKCVNGYSNHVCWRYQWDSLETPPKHQILRSAAVIPVEVGQGEPTEIFLVGTEEITATDGHSLVDADAGLLIRRVTTSGFGSGNTTFIVHGPHGQGISSHFNDIKYEASKGRVLVAGSFSATSQLGDSDVFVARYHDNGGLDISFSGDGQLVIPLENYLQLNSSTDAATAVDIAPDGSIWIAAAATENFSSDIAVIKLSPAGDIIAVQRIAIDQPGGSKSDSPADMVVDQLGRAIVLSTVGGTSAGDSDIAITRLLPTLYLDPTFGGNGTGTRVFHFGAASIRDTAAALSRAPDGRFWIAGTHYKNVPGDKSSIGVAKFTNHGIPQQFSGNAPAIFLDGTSDSGFDEAADIVAAKARVAVLGTVSDGNGAGGSVDDTNPQLFALQATSTTADVSTIIDAAPTAIALSASPVALHVEVSNAGPAAATDVAVEVTLPSGAVLQPFSLAGYGCVASEEDDPNVWGLTTVLRCSINSIQPGGTVMLELDALAPVEFGPHLFKAVSVANEVDPNSNNYDSMSVFVEGFQAIKTVSAGDDELATPGELLTYSVNLTRQVDDPVATQSAIHISDAAPAGTVFVAGSLFGPGATFDPATKIASWTIPAGTVGDPSPVGFAVQVDASPSVNAIDNTHYVDGNPACLSPPCVSTPVHKANLDFELTASAIVARDTLIEYEIQGVNHGPHVANDIVANLHIPLGSSFVSAAGNGWTCAADTLLVTCERAFLAANAAAPAIDVTLVAPSTPGVVQASCDATATEFDPTPQDDCAASTTVVDVAALKTIDAGPDGLVAPGETLTYSIEVTGGEGCPTCVAGAKAVPGDGTTFVVSDNIPAGTSYVPGSATGPDATYLPAADAVKWTVPVNFVAPLTLTFQVTAASPLTASPIDNTHYIHNAAACSSPPCVSTSTTQPALDTDQDSEPDATDNCPTVANPDQADNDGDKLGDACDLDDDNDTIPDVVDNCALLPNQNQHDSDGDGIGDICDPTPTKEDNDSDGDTVGDSIDNCVAVPNPNQTDTDKDDKGDACDANDDGDDQDDTDDNCPLIVNSDQQNSDSDPMGDACDADDDNDGHVDAADNCPAVHNPDQADQDKDGTGDACDPDIDGDNVDNEDDNCPLIPNEDQSNGDHDAEGDVCEFLSEEDIDSDGVPNVPKEDNCPFVYNPLQENSDTDEDGDACDDDDDNDGVLDENDNCQFIENGGQENSDEDEAGDACDENPNQTDADTDGDGVLDPQDNCPLVANDQANNDGDEEGDACDNDDDNDGIPDAQPDNCQFEPNPLQEDADDNGVGDVCEAGPCSAAGGDVDNDQQCGDTDICPTLASNQCVNLVVDVLEGFPSATHGEAVVYDFTLRNIGNLPAEASSVSLTVSDSILSPQWSCESCPQGTIGGLNDAIVFGTLAPNAPAVSVSVVGTADESQGTQFATLLATATSSNPAIEGNPNDNQDMDVDPISPSGIFKDGFEN